MDFVEMIEALQHHLATVAAHRRASRSGRLGTARYASPEELIVLNAQPSMAKVTEMTLWRGRSLQSNACFDNSFRAAHDHPQYRYTEGWALLDGSEPLHHAWLTGPAGEIEDVTWPHVCHAAESGSSFRGSGRAVYMGISIDQSAHRRWFAATRRPNLLKVDDRDISSPLIHGLDGWTKPFLAKVMS